MPELDEKLHKFNEAQQELYDYLGISRRLTDGEMSRVPALRYNHGSGNLDIPTAYPQVLDYREHHWLKGYTRRNSDDEIRVKIDNSEAWEDDNLISFHILTIWTQEENIYAVCSHLAKPAELEYAHPGEVSKVERGGVFYGDECLLILNPKLAHKLAG